MRGAKGLDDTPVAPGKPPTAAEVMDTIQRRIEARLADHPSNAHYRSLAERLESLRQSYIETAEESVEFLKKLLELARQVVEADREQVAEEGASAVADGGSHGATPESLLPDQRVGALTQNLSRVQTQRDPRDRRARRARDRCRRHGRALHRLADQPRGRPYRQVRDQARLQEIRAHANG